MKTSLRSLFSFLIACSMPLMALSQSINLQSAIDEFGSENYEEALKYIEKAQKHDKTKNDPKTWFYRAEILKGIATSEDSSVRALHDKPVIGAKDAYQKSRELSGEDDYKQREMSVAFIELSGPAFDKGTKAFNNEDFESALEYFSIAAQGREIYDQQRKAAAEHQGEDPEEMKADSIKYFSMLNAARSAEKVGKDTAALQVYQQLAKDGFFKGDAYLYQAEIYDRREEYDKMLELIDLGLQAYPDHVDLIRKRALYYIVEEEAYAKAEKGLEKSLEEQPDNENLQLLLATVYKDLHDEMVDDSADLAKEYFAKAEDMFSGIVGKDSSNYDAMRGLGLMYYNTGVDLNEKAGTEDDDEKLEELKSRSEESWKKAMPILKKAFEVGEEKGRDTETVTRSLMKIYAQFNMPEEYKQLKKDAGFERQ